MSPRTCLMPAAAICFGERVHRRLLRARSGAHRRVADAAQIEIAGERSVGRRPRRREAPACETCSRDRSGRGRPPTCTSSSSTRAASARPAFCAKSVSPRVSETMIAPHSPPRVWLASAAPDGFGRAPRRPWARSTDQAVTASADAAAAGRFVGRRRDRPLRAGGLTRWNAVDLRRDADDGEADERLLVRR